MTRTWKQGLIAAILGIIALATPTTLTYVLTGESNVPFYFVLRWFWGFLVEIYLVVGSMFMGIGGLRSQGYIAISILPLVLGIILGIACIILLVLAILSKKDTIPSIATKVIFIIFGVIFILLPWIEFLVENLNMIPVLIQAGLPPEVTGSPMFPIPIGSILFLVAGIFAIIGGAKA